MTPLGAVNTVLCDRALADKPVLNHLGQPTPIYMSFINQLFDSLDATVEPIGSGYMERTKMLALGGILRQVNPNHDVDMFNCPRRTKAIYQAHGYEYENRRRYGAALTRRGFAQMWAKGPATWPDHYYVSVNVCVVRFGLKGQFLRQQFPIYAPGVVEILHAEFHKLVAEAMEPGPTATGSGSTATGCGSTATGCLWASTKYSFKAIKVIISILTCGLPIYLGL